MPATISGEQHLFEALLINLPHRADRRYQALAECKKAGIRAHVHPALEAVAARMILPDSSREGGELGLNGSIVTALESISERTDLEWILVVEDDVKFTRDLTALRDELHNLGPEFIAVRAGFLSALPRRYGDIPKIRSWRDLPYAIRGFVCLRSRFAYIINRLRLEYAERRRRVPEGSFRNLQWGTHLWAVRPEHALQMREDIVRLDVAADHAFIRLIQEQPLRYRNLRRCFATQSVSASDIQDRRYRKN